MCFLAVGGAGARVARAAPLAAEAPAAQPPPHSDAGAKSPVGFEVLATVGYGASTSEVGNLDLEPYAVRFGLDAGYCWSSGFRLGLDVGYGVGRSIAQRRQPLIGAEQDVTTNASSVTGAITVGYDVPLNFLVLRYSLGLGAAAMSWDLGGLPKRSFFNEENWDDPAWGFFLAPGGSLLWRRGLLEVGVGFDYLVQTNDAIPTGFVGELLTGVKW